jgi:hypothetical protein
MSDSFFINEQIPVSQNASLYAQTLPSAGNAYEYIMSVNIASATWSSMNELFNDRVYVQNASDMNTANVALTANFTSLNSLLGSAHILMTSEKADITTKTAYGTLLGTEQPLGLRFLEIVATKVFGHAKARAAIANDSEFYLGYDVSGSLIKQLADGITGAVQNKKSDVFNAYVAYDRIESNPKVDVGENATFNFDNTNWEFPIYFRSTISDVAGADASLDELNNGPSVGGTSLVNGSMNVPVLVRFHS